MSIYIGIYIHVYMGLSNVLLYRVRERNTSALRRSLNILYYTPYMYVYSTHACHLCSSVRNNGSMPTIHILVLYILWGTMRGELFDKATIDRSVQ